MYYPYKLSKLLVAPRDIYICLEAGSMALGGPLGALISRPIVLLLIIVKVIRININSFNFVTGLFRDYLNLAEITPKIVQ